MFRRRLRTAREDVHERLRLVRRFEGVGDVARAPCHLRVARDEQSPRHRHEMRRERDDDVGACRFGELLLDLRRVSVLADAVRLVGRIELREQIVRRDLPSGSADTGRRVDDDARSGYESVLQERSEREDRGRGIAAGVRDLRGRGDRVAVRLRQSVRPVTELVGMRVRIAVPLRVERGVVEPPVRREVDDLDPPAGERRAMSRRRAVR